MDEVLLFNTPTVEGYTIETYYGFISANQVAGTGFLTDFTASISDFFGGNSGAYRDVMNRLLNDVKENLQRQAKALGGNAVIGVRVDFDNISAKNMSMFMVSMQGTAVKIRPLKIEKIDRFETYQKLYNLFLYKEKGIINNEQYEAERKNLLFSYEDEINEELSVIKTENSNIEKVLEEKKQAEKEGQRAREERERLQTERQKVIENVKIKVSAIISDVQSLLADSISDPHDYLSMLTLADIEHATYSDMGITPSDGVAYNIGQFLKKGRIADACKYYIDLVGDFDIEEAKKYILSVYDILTLKNQSAFESIAKEIVDLKIMGKKQEAVEKFSKFALCDTTIAEQVVEML